MAMHRDGAAGSSMLKRSSRVSMANGTNNPAIRRSAPPPRVGQKRTLRCWQRVRDPPIGRQRTIGFAEADTVTSAVINAAERRRAVVFTATSTARRGPCR